MQLEHAALWVSDLEEARVFYMDLLRGTGGALYENPRTGFRSYFVSFDGGARLELMSRPDVSEAASKRERLGYAHVAFRVGSREAVDALVAELEARGVPIAGRPRMTGDGYYEAVVLDPEGNRVELMAERGVE